MDTPPPQSSASPFTFLFLAALLTFGVIVIVRLVSPLVQPDTLPTPTPTLDARIAELTTAPRSTALAQLTNFPLTATELIHRATLTAAPGQAAVAAATAQVADFKATRTAIAITRDPSMLLRLTPAPVDLTVTAIVMMAMGGTPAPTPNQGECWVAVANQKRSDLGFDVEADLEAIGIALIYGGAYGSGVQSKDCSMDYYHTAFDLVVEMPAIDGQTPLEATYDTIADVLAVLSKYPEDASFGMHRASLIIDFTGEGIAGVGRIDTGYSNALRAYAEGLRGAALVEALGGFVNYRER